MSLPQNEHPVDRLVRVVLGVALLAIAVAGTVAAPLSYLVVVIAALALVTGIAGFCPLYALLRVSTRSSAHR
jgi:Inner membrane protein YgaP-like, transmembrane domain